MKNNKNIFSTQVAFLLTLFILLIIGVLLKNVSNNLDIQHVLDTYIVDLKDFAPEKSEWLQYSIITILFPIIYFVLKLFFDKLVNKNCVQYKKKIINMIYLIIFVFVFILVFSNAFYYIDIPINFQLINIYRLFDQYTYIILSALFFLLIISFIIVFKLVINYKTDKYDNLIKIIIIIMILLTDKLYVSNYAQNGFMVHHIDAYYYPVFKIKSGLSPLIDFNSLYGNYSLILALFIKNISVDSFFILNVVMSILIFIIFYLIYLFIDNIIKNKVIVLLTMGSIIFFQVIASFMIYGSPYLQYTPHRILFPVLIIFYIQFYVKNDKKLKLQKMLGFLISSFALFWNTETGFVVMLVWGIFLIYEILYRNGFSNIKTYISIFKVVVGCILSIFAYLFMVLLIIYFRTGKIINLVDILQSQNTFVSEGYYMLRMNLFHPWLLVILIYMISLIISINYLPIFKQNNRSFKNISMLFVLSILGTGIFSYYVGRSYVDNFLPVLYPCIILLGIYIDYLIAYYKKNKIVFCIVTIMIFIFYFFSISSITYLLGGNISGKNNDVISNELLKYDKIIADYKNVDFILKYESYYYTFYNLPDKKNFPAYIDLFTWRNIEQIIIYMKKTDNNIFIELDIYDKIKERFSDELKELEMKYKIYSFDDGVVAFLQLRDANGILKIHKMEKMS